MKGYIVCVYKSIDDENALKEYANKAKVAVQKYQGKFLARGGKNIATLNKNKNLSNQKRLLLEDAIASNKTTVASAWSSYQSSKSLLNSVQSQVRAAEIANEGITIEYESGLGRSTLDVIQSNSLLLDSKISFANAERNYLLSQFKLLQSIGLLTLEHLQIN